MRDMSRNARFGESGEFNQNSPNVRKYSNEVANGPMPRSDFDKYDEFGKDSPKFCRKCKGDGIRGP